MTYQEATNFLFSALPMYQKIGKKALKIDLSNILKLCAALDNPHKKFKSVHVAGTNGKGSSSHMIASVLQQAGYKTGLYTSPHLKSFTERIRINGMAIEESAVVAFVEQNQEAIKEIQPSFFEMTVAMAFDHFARAQVDIAIIEVGLGGRLDSTNIITPEVSLITNIGWDHMDTLGDSLDKIAVEKAGIIKEHVPVVIGTRQEETTAVFEKIATEKNASLHFATEVDASSYQLDLLGAYQLNNLPGVIATIGTLKSQGWNISELQLKEGLANVVRNTGLKGRWQILSKNPLTICDTGHNTDGVQALVRQIETIKYDQLYLVLGFVNDKNVVDILNLFPKNAHYTFCKSTVPRAMPLAQVQSIAESLSIEADYIEYVNDAVRYTREKAHENDLVFVGGSTFVVAELNDL